MKPYRHYIDSWRQILKPGEIAGIAKGAGFGQRNRKLTPRKMFFGLVMGFSMGPRRTLAGLMHFTSMIGGFRMSRQGFHQRFSDKTVEFFRRCFIRLNTRAGQFIQEELPGKLAEFKDCVILDATVIGFAKRLAEMFPACRTNVRAAAGKIHAQMSLTQKEVKRLRVTSERTSDCKAVRIGKWVRDRLLVFDLGYFDYGLFRIIVASGGSYVSRLKTTANGVIARVRRGCAKREAGGPLNRLIYRGPIVDLDVDFGRGKKRIVQRVIGVWNRKSKDYHWYVTSLSPDGFSAEEIKQIYRLRWQVELLFKEWKSVLRIAQFPSAREEVVLSLIYAALCASVLCRLLLWFSACRHKLSWFSMRTKVALIIFSHFAAAFGTAIVKGRRKALKPVLESLIDAMGVHAYDPKGSNAIAAFGESDA